MEKKIYFSLATVATITAIITSSVTAWLFYDVYYSGITHGYYDITAKVLSIIPVTIGILVFILIVLYMVAHVLTDKIIEPIYIAAESIQSILSGNEIKYTNVYEELEPFLKTIQNQKMEIENYISQLKKAERYRRDFTANVSHELKTPLTSINGFAEMIATGKVSREDTIKFANIIHREGMRLLELIDSIINLSRIESESENKEMEKVDVSNIAKEVISNLNIKAENKDVKIDFVSDNISILGNRRMIKDLLYNLIDNAIKYNKPKGKVIVSIKEENNYCIIKVKDTGIGIPREEQDKIFERFYMVDKSRSKKLGGSGLGLSIVKHIVKYHNGHIWLDSQVDKGTEIQVKIPIKNISNKG